MMEQLFQNVVIVGVGMIGGSMGMALLDRGLASRVIGVDINTDNLSQAVACKAISDGVQDFKDVVPQADLIIIATPVGLTPDIIKKLIPFVKPGCIITDVGSTKGKIVREALKSVPQDVHFIGGHPMTGSEIAGIRGADPYLFENAVYVLTPDNTTDNVVLLKIRKMVEALGANIVELDPDEHDMMVAAVSHLPHLAATALVNTAGDLEKEHKGLLMLAAGGFRDTTRVASGHPLMWKDICISNRENILQVLEKYTSALLGVRELIEKCDDSALEGDFQKAREVRSNIPSKLRGYLPLVHEIVVTVPDKPGSIGQVAGILGESSINIIDIEILRVREGEGGTVRLAFESENELDKAIQVLQKKGITVKRR